MSAITTHVLDTSRGRPAGGIAVVLEQHVGSQWRIIGRGETDADGRQRNLMPEGVELAAAVYRLVFHTRDYFEPQGVATFYPEIVIVFETTPGETHYHVPLLLGPFGYTTYRGT